jgi:integrase
LAFTGPKEGESMSKSYSIFRKPTYTKRNGKTVKGKSPHYYIDYYDADGQRKRKKGSTDKVVTRQMAAQLETDILRERHRREIGLRDRFSDFLRVSLEQHVADWEASLIAKQDAPKHIKNTIATVRRICKACGFERWGDIDPNKVERFLSERKPTPKKNTPAKAVSYRTYNFDLGAMQQFCNWLVKQGRTPHSPVTCISKRNEKTDRRLIRKPLTVDQMMTLLEKTEAAPEGYGMTGPQRALLYRLAVETGLRANELRTLKVSNFDLDGGKVTVRASCSKNRREITLPLPSATVETMKQFLGYKHPNTSVFKVPDRTADMLREDLERAEIPYTDENDFVTDFHALRHTMGTWLGASGAHPRTIQELMRHSDINLSMRYTHASPEQLKAAVENLPDLTIRKKSEAHAG